MSFRWLALLVVVALLFSGCTDAPAGGDPLTESDVQNGEILAPEWEIGDHWTYDSPNGTATIIVTGTQGGDWILETNDPELALIHSMADLSWLGTIRKSDLAGSQGSQRVKFFDFPLEDGKEWTTAWDGENVKIIASLEGEGRYRMEAEMGGEPYADYVYDAQVGYFDEITWIGLMDGQDWGMSLTDSGQGFSGMIHRYEIGQTHPIVKGPEESSTTELDIDGKWNELQFMALLLCNDDPAGQILVGINPPSEQEDPMPMLPTVNEPEYGSNVDCMQDQAMHDSWIADNPGGVWELGFIVAAPNGVAHLFITERAHLEVAFPQ